MTVLTLYRVTLRPRWLLWGYLLIITLAELITSVVNPQFGLLLHAVLLVVLVTHAALTPTQPAGRIALGLTLAPLIRLLSLSMPLLSFPQMAWYPLVSVPLLIAMWIIVRQLNVPPRELGLRRGNVLLQLMLIGGGFGLGYLEFVILQPKALLPALTWQTLLWPVLSLVIFTGFTEEIIFRGLLQTLAKPVFGRWAFTYVALVFAVLHIGYLSLLDVVFVFAVGFIFAYLVDWDKSILGVTFAHGLTNVTLFLILPYLEQYPEHPLTQAAPWIAIVATVLALLAGVVLAFRAARASASSADHTQAGKLLRALRRDQRLTYTDLAQRTGLSVRDLALIEHGQQPLSDEHAQLLATELERLEASDAD